jgi:hypothetical protein
MRRKPSGFRIIQSVLYIAIANPKFLLNLLSDNEKKALGLQDNPARSLRHWGRYSLPAESEWDH